MWDETDVRLPMGVFSEGDRILAMLDGGQWTSLDQLAGQFGLDHEAIARHIDVLREQGYDILSASDGCYHLHHRTWRLLPCELVRAGLPEWISRIVYLDETTSTMDVARPLDEGERSVLILAEQQSAGRGRRGASWRAPYATALTFTLLLRPEGAAGVVQLYSLATALAVAQAINKQTGLAARTKWPNDVLIGGRKVAGVLVEMTASAAGISRLALGVGINVNQREAELENTDEVKATSLRVELGREKQRAPLCAAVLRELRVYLDEFLVPLGESVLSAWRPMDVCLGQRLTVRAGSQRYHAIGRDIGVDGTLRVETEHGLECQLSAERVSIGLSGGEREH